jgi:hypothetical protein
VISLDNQRNLFPISLYSLKKAISHIIILIIEIYATVRYIIPSSIRWIWRVHVSKEIKSIEIKACIGKVTKVAYLYIHKEFFEFYKAPYSILLMHGDYGHPFTMLHLADLARTKKIPTFSLYIPNVHNNADFVFHSELAKQAIDKIENIYQSQNAKFSGVLSIGHSKGAILSAHRQFVDFDSRIKATCAIAARLNIPIQENCSDHVLTAIVKPIYEGIFKNLQLLIMQIIPKHDWNASYQSMAVRPKQHCYLVPGMHLSGLYSYKTQKCFTLFLDHFQ